MVEELKRWALDERWKGMDPMAFWSAVSLSLPDSTTTKPRELYPTLYVLFWTYFIVVEPSNAVAERDFSALALLLSPLRKGRMRMKTVERKLWLMLNKGFWHPLGVRQSEKAVVEMMAKVHLEIEHAAAAEAAAMAALVEETADSDDETPERFLDDARMV
jgi:hypothetical protein